MGPDELAKFFASQAWAGGVFLWPWGEVIAEFRETREKILVAYGGHKASEENLSVFFAASLYDLVKTCFC